MLKKFKKCVWGLKDKYRHVENNASYYIEKNGDTAYIFFEKSNGAIDWLNNFNFFAVPAKPYKNMDGGVWFCHGGFKKVWKSVEPFIQELLWDQRIKKIEIVGYSHGGALAQLCYEYVRYNRPDISVKGFGFGAPRVLWGPARKSVKKRFEGFFVVRNGCDLVTHLPPAIFGFRHVCTVIKLGGRWTTRDFYSSIKRNGLKAALVDFDFLGAVKDHYPRLYSKNLDLYLQTLEKFYRERTDD